ncbi:MAG: N-acetyl-1-D-myo-inositol-2-amino-2-deoxy-alpha-D-glucopyranoside deacetylase [Actinomycetota bacterium]|nr:N-acetyl-1-D-myo-inositol-2-amino-2-deoxy-alpha-D-glucopyranoside deacetylase [Actinomycetota bacterium]
MARLLFVHAHPDDETLTCGITMAHHVAIGDDVHTLTCTLGEEGEVVPPELAHLQGAEGDPLGPWRREELRTAMDRLGVQHGVLGEERADGGDGGGTWRDSGMAGMPSWNHPRAFARADVERVGFQVAEHLRRLRPDVVVTYDATGGYEHPDHIQTHRVTMAALRQLGPEERPASTFHIHTPRSWVAQDRAWLREHVPENLGIAVPAADDPLIASTVDDDVVTHVVDDPVHVPTQIAALDAHRTQLRVWDGWYYALTNDVAARLAGREAFVRVDPLTGARAHTGPLAYELMSRS